MFTPEECVWMNEHLHGTMMEALGMRFVASDDEIARAEMPIAEATRQYFGVLHGGASLALAETVAGAGSLHLVGRNAKVCGLQVTGNHVGMSPTQGKVLAEATLVHGGRTTHLWNVNILDETGRLLSTVRVTNFVLES